MNRQTWRVLAAVMMVLMLSSLACGKSAVEKLADVATSAAATATATPEPTRAPVESKDPTPTEAPAEPTSPKTTPKPNNLVVKDTGFGQIERSVGYAFMVSNPNAGLAFGDTQYQVTAYDADDVVVETNSGYISLVMPSQTLGVAGTLFVDEGVEVAKVEVQLSEGEAEAADPMPNFAVRNVVYRLDEWGNEATCVVENPFSMDLQDLYIYVVAYDESGAIVGGGSSLLDFVLANGTTGAQSSFVSTETIDSVEIYATVSGLTWWSTDDEAPADAQAPVLHKYGFGQQERSVGFGLIVENPNTEYAIEGTMYHVTVFDADGNVLSIEESHITLLLPGQTLGIGGDMYLPEATIADSAEVQILAGRYEASEALPAFTSENVAFQAGDWSSKTTGMIVSSYQQDITDLKVYALTYDEGSNITGGGYTFLDFVPADGKAAVEVSTTCAGTPASVELYASISSLSEFKE